MGRYVSKPKEIEAFQFVKECSWPDWFSKALEDEYARFVRTLTGEYIIINSNSQTKRAHLNDWICLSAYGKIFILDDQSFKMDFEEVKRVNERCTKTIDIEEMLNGKS